MKEKNRRAARRIVVKQSKIEQKKISDSYKQENLNNRYNNNQDKDRRGFTKPWTDVDFREVVRKVHAQVVMSKHMSTKHTFPILYT